MNKPEIIPQDDVAGPRARHKTTQVMVGNVAVGGGAPIVVQSMTNTDTADIEGTIAQVAALSRAGSEMVRITVDREEAAAAVPHIRDGLRKRGITTPLIGDFHYIGHKLLADYPACAEALDKYRINPGNVGFKNKRDTQFADIIEIANKNNKAVRIGANWGSLDQELLTKLMDENTASPNPRDARAVTREAMVQSALLSAARAARARHAQEQDDPVGKGFRRAGPDRGLPDARLAFGLRDPSRPHRSRHGIEGHRGVVGRARHPAAGRHRRHHPDFADARARRRPHAGSSGRAGTAADHGLPHLRAAGRGMPGLRPHHLDHVPGTGALDPGFHPRRKCRAGRRNIPASKSSTSRSWAASSTAPANPSTPISASRCPAPAKRRPRPCSSTARNSAPCAGPSIAADFKALVIDYIDQRYGAGAKAPETTAAE